MTDKQAEAGWKFWSLWVLASAVGWALLGWYVADSVTLLMFFGVAGYPLLDWVLIEVFGVAWYSIPDWVTGMGVRTGYFLGGALLGTAQWLVLRRQVSRVGRWVLASAVGWAVGLALGSGAWETGVLPGALLGAAQWLVLRRRVARAGWWALASAVGWAVGQFAVNVLGGLGPFVVPGVLAGAITGAVLVWLLRQQRNNG